MNVPLSRPYKAQRALEYLREVLESPYISTGPFIERFEKRVAEISGAKYAISTSSGTAALHIIVKALGIGAGDDVITTPYSFIATSNVIIYEGATPVFCDVEKEHLNLSVERVKECIQRKYRYIGGKLVNRETGNTLKAVMPVHIYGYPADMEKFLELKEKYGLFIIEDSAEALGSVIKINGRWRMVGTLGDAGVYAFYANKQITTGEGGVIVTSREDIKNLALSLRNQGRSLASEWLLHERIGYNYRMSSVNAALGLSQIELLDEIMKKRRESFNTYIRLLKDVDEIEVFEEEDSVRTNWFVFVIRLKEATLRDKVAEYMKNKGVATRPYFSPPLHLQPVYKNMLPYKEGDFPISEDAAKRVLALPFYTGISEEEQRYVVKVLKEALSKLS